MAKATAKATADIINVSKLCDRWRTNRVVIHRLKREDPDFPKSVPGYGNIYKIADVEKFEKTRTLSARVNRVIAALEDELKGHVDDATWLRAVGVAKSKLKSG